MSPKLLSIQAPVSINCIVFFAACISLTFLYRFWVKIWTPPIDPLHYQWYERRQETVLGRTRKAENESRDIASRAGKEQCSIVILWGSQTGTAEGLAHILAKAIRRRLCLKVLVVDLTGISPSSLASLPSSTPAIFFMSTYGEGNPSDNALRFCQWLNRTNSPLTNLRYTGFGLGNSTYKHYNRVIDTVTHRLDERKAVGFGRIGHGDDAYNNTDDEYARWEDETLEALQSIFGFEEESVAYEPAIQVCKVKNDDSAPEKLYTGQPFELARSERFGLPTVSPSHALPVVSIRNLTSLSARRFLHIDIDISSHQELKYRTGDHCLVWPSNKDSEVARLLRLLGLESERSTILAIKTLDLGLALRVPGNCTIESLLKHYLSICGPVSRPILQSLTQVAPNEATKMAILELCSDRDAFEQMQRQLFTLGRIMEAVARDGAVVWNSLPLSWLIENVPPLQARPYSISSSSMVSPRKISLTASLLYDPGIKVDSDAELGCGLTTGMFDLLYRSRERRWEKISISPNLEHPASTLFDSSHYHLSSPPPMPEDGKLFIQLRRSKFKLPFAPTTPIMMIAAGTGIAPFRGFIQERARLQKLGREIGKMHLFYGCRQSTEDFLYAEELKSVELQLDGALEIVTAFSREDERNKVYVQQRIKDRHEDFVNHLTLDGFVYICGSAVMARDVTNVVMEIVGAAMVWEEEKVAEFLEMLKRTRRWQEDVWN